jgi:cell division cycle 20-like protein 1 (cofactor of APC complex)
MCPRLFHSLARDVTKQKCISTLHGHTQRVSSLAWNSHLLASGSRDQKILLHDPRQSSQSSQSSSVGGVTAVAKLESHTSEVCGLEWSYDEHQLASGGNDNKLLIWDRNQSTPLCRFEHQAAVKALAWSPHQHGLLASGGGTADRCIRFWSTPTAEPVSHIDTGSQVCNLLWSKNVNEIVSTHGYSLNQIHVWRYPTMQQVATLVGHTKRVLYLAASPDGQTVVTGAGDDTLRFWNLWEGSSAALPSWSGDKQKGKMSQQGSCILPTAVESLIR